MEDLSERVKRDRQLLASYARDQAKLTRSPPIKDRVSPDSPPLPFHFPCTVDLI